MAARLGSDGFVFEQSVSLKQIHEFVTEAFDESAKAASPVDTDRSDTDLSPHQVDLVHAGGPIDAHLAEFHNFIVH